MTSKRALYMERPPALYLSAGAFSVIIGVKIENGG